MTGQHPLTPVERTGTAAVSQNSSVAEFTLMAEMEQIFAATFQNLLEVLPKEWRLLKQQMYPHGF